MPRKKTEINKNILEALKYQIKIKSGLECNSFSQITWLQHNIKKSGNENLSLQTLNRLFLIIKNEFNPSLNTLNVLSQYLKYSSFTEFAQLNANWDNSIKNPTFELRMLDAIFSKIDPNAGSEVILKELIKNTFKFLKEDGNAFSDIYQAMATSPFGRKYFFEQNINMDGLDKAFGEGLKYYMLYAGNKEQMLFATNLTCYRHFLTSNAELFSETFKATKTYSEDEVINFSPLVIGQYYATKVFAQFLEKDRDFFEINTDVLQNQSRFYERYFVAEALVLANKFEQAWYLLNLNSTQSYTLFPSGDEELVTQFNILWLMSGFYSKNISVTRATQVFSKFKERPLKILYEDLYTLLLLFLKKDLFQKTSIQKDVDAQIHHLICKTGFIHFNDYDQLLRKKIDNNYLMDINGKKKK